MTLRIIPATLRNLSHIAANLRPEGRNNGDSSLLSRAHVAEVGGE